MSANAQRVEITASGATTYIKPKDLKKGTVITGTYAGSFEDKYEKLNHRLSQEDGSTKVVNGTGQLNALMAKVKIGTPVELVYEGTSAIQSGQYKGTKAHSFKVFTLNSGAGQSAVAAGPGKSEFPF